MFSGILNGLVFSFFTAFFIKDLNIVVNKVIPEIPIDNFINSIINEEVLQEEETESVMTPFFEYEKIFRNNPLSIPRKNN